MKTIFTNKGVTIRKLFLPTILILIGMMLWYSTSFKEIGAGVAILLFGMINLEEGFRVFAEGPLRRILHKITDKFYKSLLLGSVATALLQSSSLISVIAISFISAGLLDLVGGIGIIFGANLGTTATSWLVAVFGLKLKISALAMPMLIFGIIMTFQKKQSLKGMGSILAGMGFLFLGIHYMKEGFDAFKGAIDLSAYAMEGIAGLLIFTSLGIIATVVLQSSSATMAIILTALMAGQVTYFNALALAIGANIGTTITAILGATASNAAGKRLAMAHLAFNMVTGLVAIVFIYPISGLVDISAEAIGIATDDYTMKLAVFHTIFNLLGIMVMYPMVRPLANWLNKSIQDSSIRDIDRPLYLTDSSLSYPQSAIGALYKETRHLFGNTYELILKSLSLKKDDVISKSQLRKAIKNSKEVIYVNIDELYYTKIKTIYGQIIEFATLAQQLDLSTKDISNIHDIKSANQYFVEVVKDLKDLQPNMTKYLKSDNEFMQKEYGQFRKRLSKTVSTLLAIQNAEEDSKRNFNEFKTQMINKLEERATKVKAENQSFNHSFEELLFKKKIDADMASSLLNDNAIVKGINKNLIKAARLIYIVPEYVSKTDDVVNY